MEQNNQQQRNKPISQQRNNYNNAGPNTNNIGQHNQQHQLNNRKQHSPTNSGNKNRTNISRKKNSVQTGGLGFKKVKQPRRKRTMAERLTGRGNGNAPKFENVTEESLNNQKTKENIEGSSLEELKGNFKLPLAVKVKIVLFVGGILLVLFLIVLICAVFIAIFSPGASTTQNYNTNEELNKKINCSQIEVTFMIKVEDEAERAKYETCDGKYCINTAVGNNGVETFPLETYVAGVVSGEVGVLHNEEVWKALAVAARTFVLTHNEDCKIESSDRKQVMLAGIPAQKFQKIAKETEGEVLVDKDGKMINSEYDAFACIEKTDEYYRLNQKGMTIPIEWVDTNFPNMNSDWTDCEMKNAHGRGMSQYGALYLAQYYNYSYQDILNYFYGDVAESFYCYDQLKEDSCDPNTDENCEPEYEKICE